MMPFKMAGYPDFFRWIRLDWATTKLKTEILFITFSSLLNVYTNEKKTDQRRYRLFQQLNLFPSLRHRDTTHQQKIPEC
jgi:hypothetical protein